MEKNWKRMKLKDFKKEIESLELKELEKLWKEIREEEKELRGEEFTSAMDKRYVIEGEMIERNHKKKKEKEELMRKLENWVIKEIKEIRWIVGEKEEEE